MTTYRPNEGFNEDKETVKKYGGEDRKTRTFTIYEEPDKQFNITVDTSECVADLLRVVRKKLGEFVVGTIGLCSLNCREVLDYTLTLPNYPLSRYRNRECFRVLFSAEPQNSSFPNLKDFTFLKCLGQGVSSSVYLVRHRSNHRLYALKQIDKKYFSDFKKLEQVLRQKKIMTELIDDLPFVSELFASFQSEKHLNLVIDFYAGGQMFFHLQDHKLSEEEARVYFSQICLTFQKLHERKIIYRDLKPENIMIDLEGHARLADFGLCKINLDRTDRTFSYCGSPEYMAPEAKGQSGYNYSVDFYTLGAFLYEMIVGVPPYYQNHPLFFPNHVSKDFIDLSTKLIERQVSNRISSFSEIFNSKWMSHISLERILAREQSMAYVPGLSNSYIHDEFKNIAVCQANLEDTNKYDRLFQMFNYIKNDPVRGISQFYCTRDSDVEMPRRNFLKNKKKSFSKSSNSSTTMKKGSRASEELDNSKKKDKQDKNLYSSAHSKSKEKEIDREGSPRAGIRPQTSVYTTRLQSREKYLLNGKKLLTISPKPKSINKSLTKEEARTNTYQFSPASQSSSNPSKVIKFTKR